MKLVSAFTVWMMVASSSSLIQAADQDDQPLGGKTSVRGANRDAPDTMAEQRNLAPGSPPGQQGRVCGIKMNGFLPKQAKGRAHANFHDLNLQDCDDSADITFEFVDGTVKTFHQGRSGQGIGNNPHYWVGQDDNGSIINLIREDNGIVAGSYTDLDTGDIYQMGIDADGNSIVEVTPTDEFPPEADPKPVGQRALVAQEYEGATGFMNDVSNAAEESATTRNLDETTIIDIMVIWTKESECRKAGLQPTCTPTSTTWDGMKAHIDVAISESNAAFEGSGVHAELNLVHADRESTGYTESSFSGALYDVTGVNGSILSNIRALRETYKADAVSLIIDDSQYCGIGWVGPSNSYMYSVTAWNCATGTYTFVHELGHNMGLNHDRGTAAACGGPGYNYGYREPNSRFRTVMSYYCSNGCDLVQTPGPGRYCTRVPYFSNEEFTLKDAMGNSYAMGNSGANAAQHLNEKKAIVAAYRTGSTPAPTPAATPPPTPAATPPPTPAATPPPTPAATPPPTPAATPPPTPAATPPPTPAATPPPTPAATPPPTPAATPPPTPAATPPPTPAATPPPSPTPAPTSGGSACCSGGVSNGWYAANQCTGLVYCNNGLATYQACPAGTLYNGSGCNWASQVDCNSSCDYNRRLRTQDNGEDVPMEKKDNEDRQLRGSAGPAAEGKDGFNY